MHHVLEFCFAKQYFTKVLYLFLSSAVEIYLLSRPKFSHCTSQLSPLLFKAGAIISLACVFIVTILFSNRYAYN